MHHIPNQHTYATQHAQERKYVYILRTSLIYAIRNDSVFADHVYSRLHVIFVCPSTFRMSNRVQG